MARGYSLPLGKKEPWLQCTTQARRKEWLSREHGATPDALAMVLGPMADRGSRRKVHRRENRSQGI